MTKDKDKKEKNEEIPEVDLPLAEICAHLRARGGSVGEDLRFVRYIVENDPEAVRYFMYEFSVPILRYIANNVFSMENDPEYGEPYLQLVGEYYLFIGDPFELPEDSTSKEPRWHKLSLYIGKSKARLYTYVFRITLRYFIRKKDEFVNKEKNADGLLEYVDYEALLGYDLAEEEMSAEEIEEALKRAHEAFHLLKEKDQEVLRIMVMEKTHWSKAFDLLRKYLDPLGPKKAWQSWSFEEKQAAIDQYWTPKQKQDAISLLKVRAISHLTDRYNQLKRKEHEKKK